MPEPVFARGATDATDAQADRKLRKFFVVPKTQTGHKLGNGPTALYRLYDHHEQLLYIGVSRSAIRRVGEHRDKDWFTEVWAVVLEHFATRRKAEAAERKAIQEEHPKHNVAFSVSRNLREPLDTSATKQFLWPEARYLAHEQKERAKLERKYEDLREYTKEVENLYLQLAVQIAEFSRTREVSQALGFETQHCLEHKKRVEKGCGTLTGSSTYDLGTLPVLKAKLASFPDD